jgi:catechol 2,3-dioxygenase-like lactoylglutathione lyase family enzyme
MSSHGIVSARHVDHVGMTVPNLNQAIHFFEDAPGGLLLWRVGPFHETAFRSPCSGSVQASMLNCCSLMQTKRGDRRDDHVGIASAGPKTTTVAIVQISSTLSETDARLKS